MKPVILAVLVLLLVSQNEALRCRCGGKTQCSNSIQTCYGSDQVCVAAVFHPPASDYFKSCYKASDCALLNLSGLITATCCRTDLCN